MKIIADLHIHSAYARWCSNKLNVENIWKKCIIKWIDIIWTWDFTHPGRLKELENFTKSDWNWFLIPKDEYINKWIDEIVEFLNDKNYDKIKKWFYPRFVLQTEINSVFQRWTKKSRIHNCIMIDSIKKAKDMLWFFSAYWSVESDGRLAIKMDQKDTLIWLKKNYKDSIFFPAHIWTPYFGVLWSRFGYESMREAFGDAYDLIDAIETWLSSDPIMNWINPEIDNFTILSNSDAHSLDNFGREGNVFELKIEKKSFTYKDLEKAIKNRKYQQLGDNLNIIEKDYLDELFNTKSNLELIQTIEFYPQEWKYFWNWHAKCNYISTPQDTIKKNWRCPICWWKITIWVLHRSYDVWDKERITEIWFWTKKELRKVVELDKIAKIYGRPSYRYIVPMLDVIRETWQANRWTKKSERHYDDIIKKLWSEFYVMIDLDIDSIKKYDEDFWYAMEKIRNWDIYIKTWYDWIFWLVCINQCDNDPEQQFNDKNLFVWVQESLF